MPSGDDDALGSEKAKLEMFDGSNASQYRRSKRRAQLMLASLPSTISEKKHGPKLMSFISGEAEALSEHLDIAKICSEGGDKLIWGVLDEKYGPQQIDLLQEALRGFFYDLTVKQGESFRQFQARFTAARRKLEEEKVSLPEVVLGYMLMKKLKLETQEESMLLTTTGGDLSLAKIEKAIQSVFPDGKGHLSKQNAKEVFSTEISQEQEDDLQNVMNLMADEIQAREEWDEEEILEASESYSEVRRKLAEQKKSRGYYPSPTTSKGQAESWKISGSIRGRIEALKSKTRCHRCRKVGRWKKECPMNQSSARSSTSKEVMIIEEDDLVSRQMWESFMTEEGEKLVQWGADMANDVRNAGFADSHSTGNRQRPGESAVVQNDERRPQPDVFEVFHAEGLLRDGLDPQLACCGVPDTACRRSLVGKDTLVMIEGFLKKQGLKAKKAKVSNHFKFGNSGTIQSEETVLLPANLAGKRFVIKAAILPEGGKDTPLLLGKELMRQLGCVLDLRRDVAVFPSLGVEVKLRETSRGHYAIPLFESVSACSAAECFVHEGAEMKSPGSHVYDIDKLEHDMNKSMDEHEGSDSVQDSPAVFNDQCQSSHEQAQSRNVEHQLRERRSPRDAGRSLSSRGDHHQQECGQPTGCTGRFRREPHSTGGSDEGWAAQGQDGGRSLSSGQGLSEVGQKSHRSEEHGRHAEASCLHRVHRCQEAEQNQPEADASSS